MRKKKIAREWLIFLGAIIFGLFIVPGIIWAVISTLKIEETCSISYLYQEFYRNLFAGKHIFITLLIIFSPYIVVQIIRSVAWSVKTIKHE